MNIMLTSKLNIDFIWCLKLGQEHIDNWPSTRENRTLFYANNKDTDQPAHPRILISAFITHHLESVIHDESRHEVSNNFLGATNKGSEQPAQTRSLIRAIASHLNILLNIKLLTEHHLEFLSLKGGYTS